MDHKITEVGNTKITFCYEIKQDEKMNATFDTDTKFGRIARRRMLDVKMCVSVSETILYYLSKMDGYTVHKNRSCVLKALVRN